MHDEEWEEISLPAYRAEMTDLLGIREATSAQVDLTTLFADTIQWHLTSSKWGVNNVTNSACLFERTPTCIADERVLFCSVLFFSVREQSTRPRRMMRRAS